MSARQSSLAFWLGEGVADGDGVGFAPKLDLIDLLAVVAPGFKQGGSASQQVKLFDSGDWNP